MKKQSKGITLISLIITIILLLILAGVSLAEFTGHGLFAQAQRAKLEEKRSAITEWLSIKLIQEQTNNSSGTAEEIIGATRENVIKNQNELEEMGKDINIEEVSNEENGEQVDVYFYVIVDEDVYKVELEGVKFIGRKDEFPPIIKITEVTNTTNTITVTVETQRNEEGKIEYWIKAEDEEEYRKIGETEEKCYTYEGLTQNKKYNIKVIAIAKNKKTAEATADKITGSANIDITKPTISSFTGIASSTVATEAELSATVNDADSGLSKIVWEWGTSTSYGSTDTTMNDSITGTTESITEKYSLSGLSGGTTYYAKITVYDVAGNSTTKTTSFTTGTAVAEYNSTYYTSINNAVNTVSSYGTVTMVASTTEEATIPSGKTITLNLNSKTVTGKLTNSGTTNISGGTILGTGGNTLTNSGTTVLTNVNISNDGVAIYNAGICTLKSGNILCTNGDRWTVYNRNTFNMQGGTIQLTGSGSGTALINTDSSNAKVNMSGGTIKTSVFGLVISIGTAEVTGGIIQAEGAQPGLLVRDKGNSVTVKNTTIKNTGTGKAVVNYLDYKDCIIRSRATNFGIIGGVERKCYSYYEYRCRTIARNYKSI